MSVIYRTRYTNLDMDNLLGLFSTEKWFCEETNNDNRLEACQEVENRIAAARGMSPRFVDAQPINGGVSGFQVGNRIVINSYLLNEGAFYLSTQTEENYSNTKLFDLPKSNWEILETIYHEDTHGDQIDRGTAQTSKSYIECKQGDSALLYRIQIDEREAFEVGQNQTLNAIDITEKLFDKRDEGREAYELSVKENSYEASLAQAKGMFNDENIQQTLDQFVNDREQGIMNEHVGDSYNRIKEIYEYQSIRSKKAEEFGISSSPTVFPNHMQEENKKEKIDNESQTESYDNKIVTAQQQESSNIDWDHNQTQTTDNSNQMESVSKNISTAQQDESSGISWYDNLTQTTDNEIQTGSVDNNKSTAQLQESSNIDWDDRHTQASYNKSQTWSIDNNISTVQQYESPNINLDHNQTQTTDNEIQKGSVDNNTSTAQQYESPNINWDHNQTQTTDDESQTGSVDNNTSTVQQYESSNDNKQYNEYVL